MAALLGRTDEDFESSDDTGDGRAPLIKPESKKYGSDGDLEVPINSVSFCPVFAASGCLRVCCSQSVMV